MVYESDREETNKKYCQYIAKRVGKADKPTPDYFTNEKALQEVEAFINDSGYTERYRELLEEFDPGEHHNKSCRVLAIVKTLREVDNP